GHMGSASFSSELELCECAFQFPHLCSYWTITARGQSEPDPHHSPAEERSSRLQMRRWGGRGEEQEESGFPAPHTLEPNPIAEAYSYCNTPNRTEQAWEGEACTLTITICLVQITTAICGRGILSFVPSVILVSAMI
ncbi:hypothetical protein KUCAC02_037253, partial [Chaenocephalus aceratus]